MSYASDKLYKGYLRRNMPAIVSQVKVREIVTHLPCLTDHDRETIEAKRETCGNYDSMVLLLDCLKRRESWPEQFIKALEELEFTTMASEIRAEYNALKGTNNSNPSSPPTTVIRAHVHPAPSASQLPIPESGGNSQVAVAPPAEASASPEPAAQPSPPVEIPVQPQAPPAAQVPEAVAPPELVAEPPQSAQIEAAPAPSTPPPSPETPRTPPTATPPPQREIQSHQEPVENSESDIQDIFGENGAIPDQVIAGEGEVSINSVDTPPPPRTVEPCETDTPSHPDPLQTTTTTEAGPPRSPSPTQMDSDVTDGSDFPTMTPEKPPVQDTTPPVDIKPSAPEETSEPPVTQVLKSSPQTETAATTSPILPAAEMDASLLDDSNVCLSKPGVLISIQPQIDSSSTIPAPSFPVAPYSGNSDRLEMSEDAVTSTHVPACSAVISEAVITDTALSCQENGIALNHNEPEENHYESPCPSLDMQEVRVNVVQISEEPSILNLEGQNSGAQAQSINGEAAKEITSAPPLSTDGADTVSSVNTPSRENCHPSEPAPADITEEKTPSRVLPANTKYILTAAGVGACALLMAWKFKN